MAFRTIEIRFTRNDYSSMNMLVRMSLVIALFVPLHASIHSIGGDENPPMLPVINIHAQVPRQGFFDRASACVIVFLLN